jgi:AcrR family transcriptional regulator
MVYRRTPRSDAVRAASRERILDAALDLFGSKGYDATTMQDIVTDAGTSIGNVYFYFRNKEAVATALAERCAHSLYDESQQLASGVPTGPQRVAAILALNSISFLSGRVDLSRLVAATDQRQSVVSVVGDVAVTRWVPVLTECFPDRRAEELPVLAAAMWGTSRSLADKIGRGKLDLSPTEAAEFVVRWNLRGLGLSAREIESVWAGTARFVARVIRKWNLRTARKRSAVK